MHWPMHSCSCSSRASIARSLITVPASTGHPAKVHLPSRTTQAASCAGAGGTSSTERVMDFWTDLKVRKTTGTMEMEFQNAAPRKQATRTRCPDDMSVVSKETLLASIRLASHGRSILWSGPLGPEPLDARRQPGGPLYSENTFTASRGLASGKACAPRCWH